jgi:hypothetical protein
MVDPLSMTAAQVEALPEASAAEVLSAWVKAKQTALPQTLTQSASKPHARLAKKALYQLKSIGMAVTDQKPRGEAVTVLPGKDHEAMLGAMSPLLGTGDRALYFARPLRGGGIETYQAIINDELGIVHFERTQTNRGSYRARIKELREQADISLLFVPLDRIVETLGRAMTLNDRSRTNIPAEMADGLTRLGVVPLDPDWRVPALEADDATLVTSSATLHNEPELKQWLPPEHEMTAMSDDVSESKDDAAQQQSKAKTAAERFFTPALRLLYARRLFQMADLFDAHLRLEAASLSRATARHLAHTTEPSPFATQLFVKVFELASRASTKAT